MCEFCMQHGEGKQWYLQMKNYLQELMNAPINDEQQNAIGFGTRLAWNKEFIRTFVVPAAGGSLPISEETANSTTMSPVIPISEAESLRQHKLEHFGQVLPIEDVEKVFSLASSITRIPCGCRYDNAGLVNARYCFGLGVDVSHLLGDYPELSASFEVMGKDQAMKHIRQFDDEGLMHSVWTGVTPYVIGVCNCDGDCGAFQGYIRHRGRQRFFRAEYVCQVDIDQCNGCKECMAQCQFGAQFYSSAQGKVSIEPKLCFGCGVCRAACPQGAISLVARVKIPEVAGIW